jgi:hypothetical protein
VRKAVEAVGKRKIRALLDRRERTVHIAPGVESEGRRSFLRLHEVAHDMLPWQSDPAFCETDGTLSPTTERLFEREANQGSAELLFQGQRFRKMAGDYGVGMGAVTDLANFVGASLRATLRRYCEGHDRAVCGIVLKASPLRRDPLAYERMEVTPSAEWAKRFGAAWPRVLSADGFPFVSLVATPFGADTRITMTDVNLEPVEVRIETSATRFGILVLMWLPRREILKRKPVLAKAA